MYQNYLIYKKWSSDTEIICFYGNFHNLKEYVVSLYKFTFVFLTNIEQQSALSNTHVINRCL